MSSNQESGSTTPAPTGRIERLAAYHRRVPLVVIGLGVLLLAIPIANYSLYKWEAPAVLWWGFAVSLFFLTVGLIAAASRTGPPDLRVEADRLRILLLALAGGGGFLTALLGLCLPFTEAYREKFSLGIKSWRENPRMLLLCGGAFIGGLVLMFAGLQLARVFERTQPNLRRLLYGYNAVLGGLLLCAILGLLNVLPYSEVKPFSYLNRVFDWTSSRMYTLSEQDRNFLANELKEPVEVVVLLPSNTLQAAEVETLLNNTRAITPLISWRTLSRDRNRADFAELVKKYNATEFAGLLVLYGQEPNRTFQFINGNDLMETKGGGFGSQEEPKLIFKGEVALMNAIKSLAEGKALPTLYFTQGHGELDINDMDPNRFDRGMGLLKSELVKMNYKVEGLTLNSETKSIPDTAEVVIMARPTQPLGENVLTALREFLQGTGRKGKGRLIALLDATPDRAGNRPPTGMEKLLAEYNVQVGNDRILSAQIQNPLVAQVVANPRGNNPIARAFAQDAGATTLFTFYDARTVAPMPSNPASPGRYTAEELMLVLPLWTWAETDLKASPTALAGEVRKDPKLREDKVSKRPLSVAVAVTEGGGMMPPGHPNVPQETEARLIVFGDASWLNNTLFGDHMAENLDLVTSSVNWLRGKSTIGTSSGGRERGVFRLNVPEGSTWRLVLLPIVLMLLGVVVLGSGVWVVRRR